MTEPVPADRWANLRQMLGDGRRYVALTVEAARELLAENAQLVETIRELEIRAADKDAQRIAEREARLEAQRERDNALYEKGELAGLVGEADRAREQAERQVREIRERIEAAVMEVLNVHRWKSMGVSSVECECGAVVTDDNAALTKFPADEAFRRHIAEEVRAALSGVSGPTTEGASE